MLLFLLYLRLFCYISLCKCQDDFGVTGSSELKQYDVGLIDDSNSTLAKLNDSKRAYVTEETPRGSEFNTIQDSTSSILHTPDRLSDLRPESTNIRSPGNGVHFITDPADYMPLVPKVYKDLIEILYPKDEEYDVSPIDYQDYTNIQGNYSKNNYLELSSAKPKMQVGNIRIDKLRQTRPTAVDHRYEISPLGSIPVTMMSNYEKLHSVLSKTVSVKQEERQKSTTTITHDTKTIEPDDENVVREAYTNKPIPMIGGNELKQVAIKLKKHKSHENNDTVYEKKTINPVTDENHVKLTYANYPKLIDYPDRVTPVVTKLGDQQPHETSEYVLDTNPITPVNNKTHKKINLTSVNEPIPIDQHDRARHVVTNLFSPKPNMTGNTVIRRNTIKPWYDNTVKLSYANHPISNDQDNRVRAVVPKLFNNKSHDTDIIVNDAKTINPVEEENILKITHLNQPIPMDDNNIVWTVINDLEHRNPKETIPNDMNAKLRKPEHKVNHVKSPYQNQTIPTDENDTESPIVTHINYHKPIESNRTVFVSKPIKPEHDTNSVSLKYRNEQNPIEENDTFRPVVENIDDHKLPETYPQDTGNKLIIPEINESLVNLTYLNQPIPMDDNYMLQPVLTNLDSNKRPETNPKDINIKLTNPDHNTNLQKLTYQNEPFTEGENDIVRSNLSNLVDKKTPETNNKFFDGKLLEPEDNGNLVKVIYQNEPVSMVENNTVSPNITDVVDKITSETNQKAFDNKLFKPDDNANLVKLMHHNKPVAEDENYLVRSDVENSENGIIPETDHNTELIPSQEPTTITNNIDSFYEWVNGKDNNMSDNIHSFDSGDPNKKTAYLTNDTDMAEVKNIEAITTILDDSSLIQNSNSNESINTIMPIYLNAHLVEFGEIYGRHLKSWLNGIGNITLSDINASFNKSKIVGNVMLNRGFMAMDVNVTFQPWTFRSHRLPDLPKEVVEGMLVFFKYFIQKIAINYKFSYEISWLGDISGDLDIILKNQTAIAHLVVTKQDDGECVCKDLGLDIDFDVSDYDIQFKIDGDGYLSKGLSFLGEKLFNTYIIKRIFPKSVREAMVEKLNEVRKKSILQTEEHFYNTMKQALCHLVN